MVFAAIYSCSIVCSRILFIAGKRTETSVLSDKDLISVQKRLFLHSPAHSNSDARPDCFNNESPCAYDQVGKYLDNFIHKLSDAIPSHRRIPTSLAFNGTYIKNRRTDGPTDGSLASLAEFNPTLLPLNEDLDPALLNISPGDTTQPHPTKKLIESNTFTFRAAGICTIAKHL